MSATATIPALTPGQIHDLYALVGAKVVAAITASSALGHARVAYTARDYMHLGPYPPADDNAAAAAVVVELLRGQMRPEEIMARHPWLGVCSLQTRATIEEHQRLAAQRDVGGAA